MERKIDSIVMGWGVKVEKKRMFGGFCWLLDGTMAFATTKDEIVIIRVPDDKKQKVLLSKQVVQAEMNGRIMKNWVMTDGRALEETEFERLLEIGRDFAVSL